MTVQELIDDLQTLIEEKPDVADMPVVKVVYGRAEVNTLDFPVLVDWDKEFDTYDEDDDEYNAVLL
jgi:hypothetical protein